MGKSKNEKQKYKETEQQIHEIRKGIDPATAYGFWFF